MKDVDLERLNSLSAKALNDTASSFEMKEYILLLN